MEKETFKTDTVGHLDVGYTQRMDIVKHFLDQAIKFVS